MRAVVFGYSQTGQSTGVVKAFTDPLTAAGWSVRWVNIAPARAYPFPWPIRRFFGVFPECVDESARMPLATSVRELHSAPDELVILAFPVWFLAPPPPIRSLLARHPEVFADRNVLLVTACRNMWYSAATEISRLLRTIGARPVGIVAATDTRAQPITLVTTLRWLWLGRREGWPGPAGIGTAELSRVGRLGAQLAAGQSLGETTAVVPVLAAADLLAGKAFRRWGAVVRASDQTFTIVFVLGLGAGIALGLPMLTVLRAVAPARFDATVARHLPAIP